jgi:hypothetical protein
LTSTTEPRRTNISTRDAGTLSLKQIGNRKWRVVHVTREDEDLLHFASTISVPVLVENVALVI